MISLLEGFVTELRAVGVPVRLSEVIDAHRTLPRIDLADRAGVRAALASCLIKSADHLPTFDALFDLYFAAGSQHPDDDSADAAGLAGSDASGVLFGGQGFSAVSDTDLRSLLVRAVEVDSDSLLRPVAAEVVRRHAGITLGRAVGGTFYLFRVMQWVDPDRLTDTLRERVGPGATTLSRRLAEEHVVSRVSRLRQELEAEIRRRLVADRGVEAVARTLRQPLPEDIVFLNATLDQAEQLRRIMPALARKIAAGLAAARLRRQTGVLDLRRTMRAALATAGTPVRPVFRRPRVTKPELIVLADISGSVSSFAIFTLALAFALRSEFTKVRCFVFVDGVDEVTELLATSERLTDVTRAINESGLGVWLDGRSDYGHSLESFWDRYGAALGRRSTVLVLGDGRTNYHSSGAPALRRIAERAGRLFWLNPEPVAAWNSGDSVVREYEPFCHRMVECRHVRQLRAFIATLDDA